MKKAACGNCGAIYERTEVKHMVRDKDEFKCECGAIVESWNSSRIPMFRLIKKGLPVKK